ncbi:MAG: sigma-70 family RNA polymerase sigma factor [Polyangiaceae bacterium]
MPCRPTTALRRPCEKTRRARCKEYLEQLPEAQREALVLRHVMGYSVSEIAEATEVSPNTVKDRLLRGTREMRRLIRRDQAIGLGPSSA